MGRKGTLRKLKDLLAFYALGAIIAAPRLEPSGAAEPPSVAATASIGSAEGPVGDEPVRSPAPTRSGATEDSVDWRWGETPGRMLRQSLLRQISEADRTWERARNSLLASVSDSGTEALVDYQRRQRDFFMQQIGGWPHPIPGTGADTQPVVVGQIDQPGYQVQRLLYQSQPQFYVSAALFLPDPDRHPAPWPGVVVVCGHSADGKSLPAYQQGAALAAYNGLAACLIDPIGQGERRQLLTDSGTPIGVGPTVEHCLIGTAATPVGWNPARWMVHDAARAIDMMAAHPLIRADRFGCMGNSGGGTQTSYLMALDERVAAAAPACYLSRLGRVIETIGPQDAEQVIFGQLAFGLDHPDFVMMRAPRPTLVAAAIRDYFPIEGTRNLFDWGSRLYRQLGAEEQLVKVEVDAEHGWHPDLRRASVDFMLQHLAGRPAGSVQVPELGVLSPEQLQVTESGQVLHLPGAVSVIEHVRAEAERIAVRRRETTARWTDAQWRERIATRLGIEPSGQDAAEPLRLDLSHSVGQLQFTGWALPTAEDSTAIIWMMSQEAHSDAYKFLGAAAGETDQTPDLEASGVANTAPTLSDPEKTLWLLLGMQKPTEPGELPAEVLACLAGGGEVVLVDVRGAGLTEPADSKWYHQRFGRDASESVIAYALGQSLVGLRTEDLRACVEWLAGARPEHDVHLLARGPMCLPALHLAALEPSRIMRLELQTPLPSYQNLIDEPQQEGAISSLVHGSLLDYELSDLIDLYLRGGGQLVAPSIER
jgi:dienelactone hydrolase